MLQNADNQYIKDLSFKIVVLNVVGSSPTGHPTEGSLYTRASLLIYKELRGVRYLRIRKEKKESVLKVAEKDYK